jgi:uncharacterized membrane protein YfcA
MVSSAPRAKVSGKALWYLAAGAAAGMLAGFLGIGGGIILVPVMVGLLGLTEHKAHGTSLLIIVPVAAVGTTVYALQGSVDWTFVAIMATTSTLGAVAGVKLMMKVSARRLRQLFGLYAIVVAVLLLVR